METFRFTDREKSFIEKAPVPFGVYQSIEGRVLALAVSEGFRRMFGYSSFDEAYQDLNNRLYRHTHPDDAARIEDAAYRFATEGGDYEVIYRSRNRTDGLYHIIIGVSAADERQG